MTVDHSSEVPTTIRGMSCVLSGILFYNRSGFTGVTTPTPSEKISNRRVRRAEKKEVVDSEMEHGFFKLTEKTWNIPKYVPGVSQVFERVKTITHT